MVLADKSDAGKKSRASSPNNGQRSESSSDEREGGGGMRVGRDYQAAIPPLIPTQERKFEQYADRALLVWSPNNDIPESKLEEYITVSKEKYGYNTEQALGMLFWHKHDLEKAVTDLSNFTPFPDEWSVEDKVLFEQAFQFHGKSFHRIRQMLPDKTIAALVRYYYSWKKIRVRSSLMDKQIRRIAQKGTDDGPGEDGSEGANSPRSEPDDSKAETKDGDGRSACSNCGISCLSLQNTNKGNLCGTCAQYFKKTGLLRPTLGPIRPKDKVHAHSLHSSINRHKRGPPKGMYLEHDALLTIATGDQGQGEAILKDMDGEVVSLKRVMEIDLGSSGSEASTPVATTPGHVSPVAPTVTAPPPSLATPVKLNTNAKLATNASPAQTQAVK